MQTWIILVVQKVAKHSLEINDDQGAVHENHAASKNFSLSKSEHLSGWGQELDTFICQ